MEPSLKSIGRNSKKKGGAILSAELRHSWGAVYGHPSCASWGFIMLFKIVDCTARWGIGKELQSHCKPRGNPRADDWMFFFCFTCKLLPCGPTSPTSPCFVPPSSWCWHTSVPFPFFCFAWEPHCPFSSPFSVAALLCYPSPIPPLCFSAALRSFSKPEFKGNPREERLPRAMHLLA